MQENPKCLVCGEKVEGIDKLDVPYHIECVLKLWRLREETARQKQLLEFPSHQLPIVRPVPAYLDRPLEAR